MEVQNDVWNLEMLLTTRTLPSQRIIEPWSNEAQHLKGCTEEKTSPRCHFPHMRTQSKAKISAEDDMYELWIPKSHGVWMLQACMPSTKQAEGPKEKKGRKKTKHMQLRLNKSPSEMVSSSHNTAAIFLQKTSWTYTKHANHNVTFNDSDYLMVAKNQPTETHKIPVSHGLRSNVTLHSASWRLCRVHPHQTASNLWCGQYIHCSYWDWKNKACTWEKGRWLTLHDTLFSPQATLCLISIGCLSWPRVDMHVCKRRVCSL